MILVCATMACTYTVNQGHVKQKENNQPLNISNDTNQNDTMKLGAFSISLNVKNLAISQEFYENLGFTVLAGSKAANYLIMKNENALIGLFQGMFEGNILTFNPGWDYNGKDLSEFNDIRDIQGHLKNRGIISDEKINSKSSGPASMMINDPDGNVILLDQHR